MALPSPRRRAWPWPASPSVGVRLREIARGAAILHATQGKLLSAHTRHSRAAAVALPA